MLEVVMVVFNVVVGTVVVDVVEGLKVLVEVLAVLGRGSSETDVEKLVGLPVVLVVRVVLDLVVGTLVVDVVVVGELEVVVGTVVLGIKHKPPTDMISSKFQC